MRLFFPPFLVLQTFIKQHYCQVSANCFKFCLQSSM